MRIDHQVPITSLQMFSSPYLEIPIAENDPRGREPLIPLDSVGVACESYYAKTDGNNPPFGVAIAGSQKDIWLRKSVAQKLARVNQLLRPFEAELFVLDGHRSVACQQGLWNFFYTRAKQQNPTGSDKEHRANARQFIVDPVAFDEADSRTWPAHTNGDTFVVFRALKVMHAGDVFAGKGTPFMDRNNGGNGVTYPETIARAAAGIKDVDTVIPGHSAVTTFAAFVEFGEFNKAFLTAMQDAKKAGKTAEQAAAELKLPEKFKDYNVGRAKVNAEAIYADLQ
jgi:glyoxylase-like metal-dependent hydrolase (beta-lactamase superfamily II)